MENFRLLTQEQQQAARQAAVRSVGPKPAREHFTSTTISRYPVSVTRSIVFLAATCCDSTLSTASRPRRWPSSNLTCGRLSMVGKTSSASRSFFGPGFMDRARLSFRVLPVLWGTLRRILSRYRRHNMFGEPPSATISVMLQREK